MCRAPSQGRARADQRLKLTGAAILILRASSSLQAVPARDRLRWSVLSLDIEGSAGVPSERTNEATRREWRELGFFYDRDDDSKKWRIVGARDGIEKFADAVAKFASNPRNRPQSEHDHLGPYMYLEIGSWPKPEITDHWIAGPLDALTQLADHLRAIAVAAKEDETFLLREVVSPDSAYELRVEIRPEPFDPAKEDPCCW